MYAWNSESDIDLFIVSDPGRLWLVRGLATLTLQVLGVRRYGDIIVGRFCLSFFATTQGMDLSTIAIPRDVYLREWGRSLKPIWSHANGYSEFLRVNSEFLGAMSHEEDRENRRFCVESIKTLSIIGSSSKLVWVLRTAWVAILNIGEALFRGIIRLHTLREYERLGKPWGVIISDDILKFHPDDRRVELRDAFEARQ
jgi:hypothetical protein